MHAIRHLPRAASAMMLATASAVMQQSLISADPELSPAPFSPSEFRKFKVTDVKVLTHDTKKYTIELPQNADPGMKVASVVMLQLDVDGVKVARPYTPTSPVRQRGSIEFIIKSYPQGKLSKAMDKLSVGGEVEVKGPYTKYEYKANTWTQVALLAGGTGITPMYQLIESILSDPRDTTRVVLLYASRTPEDIILKKELDALAAVHTNFRVFYTVGMPAQGWEGSVGHVTRATLERNLPAVGAADTKIMVCGPPGFYKAYSGEKKSPSDQGELAGLLKDMGYSHEQVFKY